MNRGRDTSQAFSQRLSQAFVRNTQSAQVESAVLRLVHVASRSSNTDPNVFSQLQATLSLT